jgi:hypothetical protein
MGCFTTILFLAGFVMILVTFIRWFEQTTEAVDNGWWNKIFVLLMCPFTVWMFPSRVNAGRSSPVPRHEPVRGFGSLPKAHTAATTTTTTTRSTDETQRPIEGPAAEAAGLATASDEPPPGTPKEFLGLPKVPPPKPRPKSSIDPDKIAKLRQKMREQGMLPPDDQSSG